MYHAFVVESATKALKFQLLAEWKVVEILDGATNAIQ